MKSAIYMMRFWWMRFWLSKQGINNPYTQLLSILILMLIISPFLSGRVSQLLLGFIFIVNMLAIINLLHLRKKSHKIFYLLLAITELCLLIAEYYIFDINSPGLRILSALVKIFFISIAINLMTRNIFKSRQVNADFLKGGICIYLLIGYWFNIPYDLIYALDPQAFLVVDGAKFDPVYFSYVTLTTTGYGDIIPMSPYARMFVNLEGIMGILYPAIIIARLVSLYSIKE